MSIPDFFSPCGPWIPQMIPIGSLDGNISITFAICFATVLHEGEKRRSLFTAHMWITNCTIIAQMIDSVIFRLPVGHVSASVCAATDLCLSSDISEGR